MDVLTRVVKQARRRALWNLIFDNLTVGLIAGLCGALLLLFLGSAILEWTWVAALFVLGAAVSAWRTWRNLPSEYVVAQQVDQRLELHDSLSTAYYYATAGASAGRHSESVLEIQRNEAAELAKTLDLAAAIPARMPRHAYAAVAMVAAVSAMFFVRYGIRGTLDLRAPIVEAVADFFRPGPEVIARNKQSKAPRSPGEEPMAIPIENPGEQKGELDKAPDSALNTVEVPDTDQGAKAEEKSQQQQVKASNDTEGDDMAEGNEKGGKSGENGKEGGQESAKNSGQQDAPNKQQAENQKNAQQGGSRENSSMLDKMRDAMANLMAKMKIPPQSSQKGQQMASNQKGGQKAGDRQEGGGQKGEKGQGQSQGKGSPSDDPDAQQAEGEQQAQAGQGKSSDKGSEQGSPNESKSGMGKQDGSKDLKDAEQVAAMGKISEIFGKRAQNVTGEVMVEVSSGKAQQLRTAYTQRGATHREAGGEIHRDEIPLEFQHYVQQYFEQVRKGEGAPAGAAKPATAPAPKPAPNTGGTAR